MNPHRCPHVRRSPHAAGIGRPAGGADPEAQPTAHQRRLRTLLAFSRLERAAHRDEGRPGPTLAELAAEVIVLGAVLEGSGASSRPPGGADALAVAYDHALALLCEHLGLACRLAEPGVDVGPERHRLRTALSQRGVDVGAPT